MISKTKIRNYKSKKYANTLKNKKRTKMRGGSASVRKNLGSVRRPGSRSRKHQPPPEEYIPHQPELLPVPPPKVKNQMDNFIDSFECPSKLQFMHVDIPDFEFKKYSCQYNQSENYKKHMSYLYFKKKHIGEESNLDFEVYKVYAPNNQSISIEHKILNPKDEKYKEFGKLYDITPLELSVDTMQLAINTGKLNMTSDEKGNSYLGFVDFPSLLITEKYAGSGFSYTSREYANWISVYEEKFEDNEKLFELIVTSDGRHIDKHTLELEIKIMQDKIHILKANKRNSDLEKIEELNNKIGELNTEISKPVITMSNEELFIMKQNEMRTLLEGVKTIDIDEKEKEKQKIVEQVKYRAYVSLEDEEDIGDIGNKNVISENIGWVMKNALWLEKYLEIKNNESHAGGFKGIKLKNNVVIQDYDELKNSKAYKCDLSGLDEKYIIVDDKTCPGYVICGYPDKNMKEMIIHFWQNQIYNNDTETGYLNKVHKEQKTNNSNYFLDLFKEYKKKKVSVPEQLYTEGDLYMNLRQDMFEYIEKRYDELYSNSPNGLNDKEYINFKTNFIKNAQDYFQKIGEKYLPKPLTKIKYVFLVFKKNNDLNNALVPFIFNVKELIKQHEPILQQIERLIKHELPYKFGILSDNEYNNGKGNDTDPFDDEYKLWYSRYNYGECFHITTEYLHSMSNISDKAHGYKNSITLAEIIYACSLNSNLSNPFAKDVRFVYEVRDYKISKLNSNDLYNVRKLETLSSDCSIYEVGKPNESRSDFVFCLYEKEKKTNLVGMHVGVGIKDNNTEKRKNLIQLKKIFTSKNIDENKIRFILMYKTHKQTYTFIYCYEFKFYKLVIESNISNILDYIINELNKKILSNNFNNLINNYNLNSFNKVYKIVSHNVFNEYSNLFKHNPFIINNISIPKKLDMSYYYKLSLLKMNNVVNNTKNTIKNLYTEDKPYIYINNIIGEKYINGFKTYINNLKYNKPLNLDCTNLTFENKFKGCAFKKCIDKDVIINCAYYNIGNSGYDIIECIDNASNKLVLYIVPHNYNYESNFSINPKYEKKYLGNVLDLDDSSLPILYEIKKKYANQNNLCFAHYTNTVFFYTLHFHIIPIEKYKRIYPKLENGQSMIQDLFIDKIINNIKANKNFYLELNYELIIVD